MAGETTNTPVSFTTPAPPNWAKVRTRTLHNQETHLTKLQKLLCLKYLGRTVDENSVGFQTKNEPPSGPQEMKGAFSVSFSYIIPNVRGQNGEHKRMHKAGKVWQQGCTIRLNPYHRKELGYERVARRHVGVGVGRTSRRN